MKKSSKIAIVTGLLLTFSSFVSLAGNWQQDTTGWRYLEDDGTYITASWFKDTDKSWYHFDQNGYMQAGQWALDEGYWFYLGTDGKMITDAMTPDGFYIGPDGKWAGTAPQIPNNDKPNDDQIEDPKQETNSNQTEQEKEQETTAAPVEDDKSTSTSQLDELKQQLAESQAKAKAEKKQRYEKYIKQYKEDLESAQGELARAREERPNKILKNGEWVWEVDYDDIRAAQKKVDKAQEKIDEYEAKLAELE